ncbi:STAS domain-containing protein [Geitlerinema splendidum]|nr:STAS domain-containing protein [Geitlerinema splendidum]
MQTLLAFSEYTTIQPQGHINAANALELQQQLTSAVSAQAAACVLVDLSQVESLDSAGLMALVSALSLAQRQGQRFTLCSVSPSLRIIFELTQLDRVFEIFENSEAFAASLKQAA